VFNNKLSSPLQVIYRCTGTLHLWPSLQRVEHRDQFLRKFVHDWRLRRGILFPIMGGSIIFGSSLLPLMRSCICSL
jgi:hypothetical protein